MRKMSWLVFVVVILFPCLVQAAEFPKPNGFVNDFAGVMSSAARQKLEARVIGYEKATSYEIAVATIPDLAGRPISDYAIYLFKDWGIGKKKLDNGVLLLIAPNEPKGATKAWIVTGRGVEETVTDLKSGRIIAESMKPLWKEGKREEAIVAGVERIISVLGNTPFEKKVEEKKKAEEMAAALQKRKAKLASNILQGCFIVGIIVFGICLAVYFFKSRSKRREKQRMELEQARRELEYVRNLAIKNHEKMYYAASNLLEKIESWKNVFEKLSMFILEDSRNEMKKSVEDLRENAKLTVDLSLEKDKINSSDHESLAALCSVLDGKCKNIARDTRIIDGHIGTLKQAEESFKSIPNLFKKIDELIVDTEKKVGREDVSTETRERLIAVKAMMQKEEFNRDAISDKNAGKIDWIAFCEKLSTLIKEIGKINCNCDVEVEYAKKAREKAPQLFSEMENLVSIAEGKVSQYGAKVPSIKTRLENVKKAHQQANSISNSDSVDWVVIYPILQLIQKEIEGISSDILKFEERQRESIRKTAQSRNFSRASSGRNSSMSDDDTYRSSGNVSSGTGVSISVASEPSNFGGGDTGGGGAGGTLD